MSSIILIVYAFIGIFMIISRASIFMPGSCPSKCPLKILNFHKIPQTIIIDISNNSAGFYKNCLLKCAETNQSLSIATKMDSFTNSTLLKRISTEHNVVLFLNLNTPKDSLYSIMNILLRNCWSTLLMIFIERDNNICCDNFTNHEMFNSTGHLFDRLWHKFNIINVIGFYPFICPTNYITYDEKRFNILKSMYGRSINLFSREEMKSKLMSKRSPMALNLTRDFPLRASIFKRFPTSITECKNTKNYLVHKSQYSAGYCGLDGLLMAEVVDNFGFNLSLSRSKGHHVYGYVTPSGEITGTLGNIVRGEADIAFNSRFLTDYGTYGFQFLPYSSRDALCALVNRPEELPLWLFPYDACDEYLWLLIICTFVTVGVFRWAVGKISKKKNMERDRAVYQLHELILDSLITGIFGFSKIISRRNMVLKGLCFFAATVLTAMFQGHVNYAYTTVVFYKDIVTLQDLHDSGMTIASSAGVKALVQPPYNELHSALIRRMTIDENTTLEETLIKTHHAALQRRSDAILEVQKYYTDAKGIPLFNVVKECFRSHYLSIIAREGFPFADHIQVHIERLLASGLPDRYYKWTRMALGLPEVVQSSGVPTPRAASPLALKDLRVAFVLLLAGYIVSCVVLFVERKRFNRTRCV